LSTVYRTLAIALVLATGAGGCVLAPHGNDERANLHAASPPFEPRIEARQLPELPAVATWQDVLSRDFLVNGELESNYFDWRRRSPESTKSQSGPIGMLPSLSATCFLLET
jgi:hypothetical protein